jgi:uncharacterized membrane protein
MSATQTIRITRLNPALTRILWGLVIFLAFLGVGVATRRAIVLFKPGALSAPKNPAAALDAHFASRRTITLTHILPGILFMVLGPLQFIPRLRARHPRFHRWTGRIFLTASAVIGITGLTMAAGQTIGGLDEKAAIFLFGTLFLFSLAKALWHAMHREFVQHREWMIRGYSIGLAVATIRPIMGVFFASAVLRGHAPNPGQFFGIAFWIGFTVQFIAAEIWIRYTRTPQPVRKPAGAPQLSYRS